MLNQQTIKIETKSSIILCLLITWMLSAIQGAGEDMRSEEEGHLMVTLLEQKESIKKDVGNHTGDINQGIGKVAQPDGVRGNDVAIAACDGHIDNPRGEDSEDKEDDTSSIREQSETRSYSDNKARVFIDCDAPGKKQDKPARCCCCIL